MNLQYKTRIPPLAEMRWEMITLPKRHKARHEWQPRLNGLVSTCLMTLVDSPALRHWLFLGAFENDNLSVIDETSA